MKLIQFSVFFFLMIVFTSFYGDDFIIDEPGSSSTAPSAPAAQNGSTDPVLKMVQPSGNNNMNFIGSVPTAINPKKGILYSDFVLYDSGGFTTRIAVGVLDIVAIGVTENFDYLIGSGPVNVNVPGAYVRVTPIKEQNRFSWSLGFDSFAYGRNGTFYSTNTNVAPSTIYGFYTCGGWRYSILGGDDLSTFGFRIPLLPSDFRDLANSSIFMGTTVSFSKYFVAGLTLENIYLSFNRPEKILPSIVLNFFPVEQFRLSLLLQYEFDSKSINRILSLGYEASF